MVKYILKRVLLSVVILFFAMFIIFVVMRSLPTSFIEASARALEHIPGQTKSYEELLEMLAAQYGMSGNIFQGFFTWLGNAIRGEFGNSWQYTIPVTEKFGSVIWYSFWLSSVALILQIIIAIPLGIWAARKQYKAPDYVITVLSLIGISLPTFFIATLLQLIFPLTLGWPTTDAFGSVSRYFYDLNWWGQMWDRTAHMVLPIATVTIVSIGGLMRYTRANMLEVLNADYIRTARAKGVTEGKVVYRHAFRNTLIPLVTVLSGVLPSLFGGSLITETLFQIPGIGYTSYTAMMAGDIPFTMFYLSLSAILMLISVLVADIMYAVVDPRVRLDG